ncbi:hypothetical protein [Pseudomonas sp. CFBP 13719]|uniref:hypothetical protein n=1 Tax=Pseudomonas sp. CFBP 13719 TaxID=2775303 RepID=UPI001781C265|nr:hypothetical protein [Pseudomonas sp. CFBP 13719]MBD8615197.1 hypothetical protein [Pseudomonas putida]MBD8682149.1 hypothetical protein [Pseudomonas sp. CFBP 13719]
MKFFIFFTLGIVGFALELPYLKDDFGGLESDFAIIVLATVAAGFFIVWVFDLFRPSAFEKEMAARTRTHKEADRKATNSRNRTSSSGSDGYSGFDGGSDCGSGSCGGGGDGGGGGGGD